MPELPEVESVVRALAPVLTGRSIKSVEVRNASTVAGSPGRPAALAGRRIDSVARRGKYILVRCDHNLGLAIHLRMTGWLGVKPAKELAAEADPYVRVLFHLHPLNGRARAAQAEALVFRDIRKFGRVWCGRSETLDALKALAKLGPDALQIEPAAFAERLRARRGRLKSLLLDQTFLAGLGNIYADEALHEACVHPLQLAQRLSKQKALALHAAVKGVLERACAAGGSSIDDYLHPDGTPGWFQRELKVYGREGEPCRRCGAKVRRVVVGQRGTWFCPKCQRKA